MVKMKTSSTPPEQKAGFLDLYPHQLEANNSILVCGFRFNADKETEVSTSSPLKRSVPSGHAMMNSLTLAQIRINLAWLLTNTA